MNFTTVDLDHIALNSWSCLKIPGFELPNTGVAFSSLLLQLLVVYAVTQAFHRLIFSHLGLTPIVSQLFAGLLLCPDWYHDGFKLYQVSNKVVFPHSSRYVDECLAMLAYMLFLFLIAVKMDFSIILKTGQKAFVIGILDLIIPVSLDLGFLFYLYPDLSERIRSDSDVGDLYINLTLIPLTHFPNTAVLLADMKMSTSELGRLALSASLIGHILSMTSIVLANSVTRTGSNVASLVVPFALVVVSVFVFRPICKWIIKQTPKGRPVEQLFLYSGYMIMFIGALTTEFAGQLVLLGAFIVGTIVPDGLPLGAALVDKLDFFVSNMLLPFFVTISVMGGTYYNIGATNRMIFYHVSLAIISFVSKFVNSLLCGLYSKLSFHDALALSFIMCTKGIVDVGLSTMFVGLGVLSRPSYTVIVMWITFAATISPLFVKALYHPLGKYAGFQRRDIMHCRYNAELRILACFRRPESVASLIRLLKACSPSENNRLCVHALHLVKLVGRAHPAFIAHDTQMKKCTGNSYSEDVVFAFYRFEQMFGQFLSARVFTAVSPAEAMHEDVCTLALDKLVSVILLPFHRRFRIDGSVDSEDKEQRILNSELLNNSPCSVAILVDRGRCGHLGHTALTSIGVSHSGSPLSVAVVYIGGQDDQEALALAKRMGRDSRVRVCVIRLVVFGQASDLDTLDSAALLDIQTNELYSQQFTYAERTVKDGVDTIAFLKSAVGCYDIVMAGRHYNFACTQLMGLKLLSEDTELGAIGDFLASDDLSCRTSVLVVQQQRNWAFK